MEDLLKQLKISTLSYVLFFFWLLGLLAGAVAKDYLNSDVLYYGIYSIIFYSLTSLAVYVIFTDIINSPKNMEEELRRKLRLRLGLVIFILIPVVAAVDMKAQMMLQNWSLPVL